MTLRVGYLFNHAGVVGGGELSLIDLATSVRDFGVEPVVIVPGEGVVQRKMESEGIRCLQFDWPKIGILHPFRFLAIQRSFSDLILKEKFDLVHANGARCMLYAGRAVRRCDIPCVWHVRVTDRDGWLDRIRAHYASAIIANSKAVAASLEHLGIEGGRVAVIYNGFNLEVIRKLLPVDLASDLGIQVRPVVLAAGRFTPWKRFEDLISAAAKLKEEGLTFSVLLVGKSLPEEAHYEDKLRRMVSDLRLRDVHFVGWRDDLPSIMKAVNIFALTSDCEPFGRVIIESWMCGVPVVATRAGGPAEIVRHGENGLLYEPGNVGALAECLKVLLHDPALRARLVSEATKDLGGFSMQQHVEAVCRLYNELVRRNVDE